MYTRTIIYRVYSIVIMIAGVLGFLGSIVNIIALSKVDLFTIISQLPGVYEISSKLLNFSALNNIIMFVIGICAVISLFFSYTEFSSMYAFADMIEYEKRNEKQPMKRGTFIFSGKFYSTFGLVIFSIVSAVNAIIAVLLIISQSVQHKYFLVLPVIPLLIMIVQCLLYYINYFIRYRSIGDLLDVVTTYEVNENQKQRIKEIKTGWLRGYCVFLYVLCAIFAIAMVIAMFLSFKSIHTLFGLEFAIGCIIFGIITSVLVLVCTGIYGCYMDNIAKMVEHYQIQFGLFEKREN